MHIIFVKSKSKLLQVVPQTFSKAKANSEDSSCEKIDLHFLS